jgi:hypothetical protein
MSSTTLYESMAPGPLRFTGIVTWSIGRLPEGLNTPPHAALVLGRQKGVDVVR